MSPTAPSLAAVSPADERIQEEAALWFARLRGDEVSDDDHAAFAAWREANARHRREYEILERMWDASAPLRQHAAARPKRGRALRVAAGFAGVALLAGWLVSAQLGESLTTGAGERRHVQLADGSELDLAPNTRLRVKFGSARRHLELEAGEIAVSVAADPRRPFEVAAGGGTIRDIGTRFGVCIEGERTRVAVAEGAVEISVPAGSDAAPRRVGAGERAEFDDQGVSPARPVDAGASLAWTRGQIVFDAAPLAEVAATLNRYRRTPIELADPAVANIRISGVFLIDDEASALRAIGKVAPVEFAASAGKIEARIRRSR
jgi:transmembrane sensor